jgi:DNA-binding IclR family transcriptional regulator
MLQSRGIQSIEVGGALLKVLMEVGVPMSLKALAEAAHMPTSKAHPYLASFGRLGLVSQNTDSGLYGLGPMALQLGLASLRQLDPVRVVMPLAEQLATDTGQSVALSVWGNQGATVIRLIESAAPIHVNMRPGTVLEMTQTATGLAFAACLPRQQTASLLNSELRRLGTSAADRAAQQEQFAVRIAQAKQKQIARAIGHPIPGVNAFAAPVCGPFGEVQMVVTVLGPAASFSVQWDGPCAKALRQATDAASSNLGLVKEQLGAVWQS